MCCRDDVIVYSSTSDVLSCETGESEDSPRHFNMCMLTYEQYNQTTSLSQCEFDCGLASEHLFIAFSYYMKNVTICEANAYID